MKRLYRNLEDDTKKRIAQSLRGRTFSDSHKQAISDYRPSENNESNNQDNETSM